jgi:hypothetical protein
MEKVLIVTGVIGALAVVVVPMVAIVLVSCASLREESARSLSGAAPSSVARLARRMLGFHGVGTSAPGSGPAPAAPEPGSEVRFAYARRTLSDPRQQSAGRQSEPGTVRTEQRQTAGV